jgi:hypothetical protein
MTAEEFFRIVPARQFFTKYCPDVKRYNHKKNHVDGNGKYIDFTADDKKRMSEGIKKLNIDLKKVKF